jgi:hypothetical protein
MDVFAAGHRHLFGGLMILLPLVTMQERSQAMIELTQEQVHAVAAQNEPVQLVNPQTKEVYVLIRRDIYRLTSKILSRWDDPDDDDLIEAPNAAR